MRLAAILVVALTILPAVVVSAQDIPRHPPIISPIAVEPIAEALADRKDYAYIARLAWLQTVRVVNLTGTSQGPLGALESVLMNLYVEASLGNLERAEAYRELARKMIISMNKGDLANLAMDNPVFIPACQVQMADSIVYVISNPLEDPTRDKAPCVAPEYTIRVETALDTILAILSTQNLTSSETYLLTFVHVPRQAAYPEIVKAVLEGGLTLAPQDVAGGETANTSIVEALLEKVKNGSQEEALQALQQLLEMARKGEIPYSVYARALGIYQSRFGLPPQETREEEEVNLTQLVSQMDALVQAAERARAEAGIGGQGGPETVQLPSTRIVPRQVVYLAAVGLSAVAVARGMRGRRIQMILPRALIGLLPRELEPEWCYRATVSLLSMRGFRKEAWETPREYLERVLPALDSEVGDFLQLVTEAYESQAYGGQAMVLDRSMCSRELRRLAMPWSRLSAG